MALEKRNKTTSQVRKLINVSGEEITDQKLILEEVKSFYTNLYTSKSRKTERECLQYIASINTPKLSDTDKLSCEGKLTLQNCWDALSSMKSGKTPGNDGLTKEFYVCFSGEVAPRLVNSLNYSFKVGELSISQKQAVITVIEKRVEIRDLSKLETYFAH